MGRSREATARQVGLHPELLVNLLVEPSGPGKGGPNVVTTSVALVGTARVHPLILFRWVVGQQQCNEGVGEESLRQRVAEEHVPTSALVPRLLRQAVGEHQAGASRLPPIEKIARRVTQEVFRPADPVQSMHRGVPHVTGQAVRWVVLGGLRTVPSALQLRT